MRNRQNPRRSWFPFSGVVRHQPRSHSSMLSLLRRWILPSTASSQSIAAFFSPHYVPPLSLAAGSHRISRFSTSLPTFSDNKPSNPGTKQSSPATPNTTPSSTSPTPSTPPQPQAEKATDSADKPAVNPAWNELMSILTKHVYDSNWSPEAQARYTHIIEQYPYISPDTVYQTGLPVPVHLNAREACQSAAEEALFADYRPLRASFAEDYTCNGQPSEGEVTFDLGAEVMYFQVDKAQLFKFLKNVAGQDVETARENVREMLSTRRKRYLKMKKHKRRKL